MTFRSGGGLGQGSGSNQTLRHSPPLSRSRLIQHMPCNSTLTVRLGVLTALRCVGATNFGGTLRRPGAMPRSKASSTLVPCKGRSNNVPARRGRVLCCCSTIMSVANWSAKMSSHGRIDIDAEGADETSGAQQRSGRSGAGMSGGRGPGSERTPHEADSGGLGL